MGRARLLLSVYPTAVFLLVTSAARANAPAPVPAPAPAVPAPAPAPAPATRAAPANGEPPITATGKEGEFLRSMHNQVHFRWTQYVDELAKKPASDPLNKPSLEVEILFTVRWDGSPAQFTVGQTWGSPRSTRPQSRPSRGATAPVFRSRPSTSTVTTASPTSGGCSRATSDSTVGVRFAASRRRSRMPCRGCSSRGA